jgi:archaellum component FlaC
MSNINTSEINRLKKSLKAVKKQWTALSAKYKKADADGRAKLQGQVAEVQAQLNALKAEVDPLIAA